MKDEALQALDRTHECTTAGSSQGGFGLKGNVYALQLV